MTQARRDTSFRGAGNRRPASEHRNPTGPAGVLLYRHTWPTRAAARSAVFECIEAFYNRERWHSTLGKLSPADYESADALAWSG